ncbi:hypothetical protein NE237_004901 [Protea cynaroides]|uniref:Pollen Ole e 1 allergen and extensin family protein n=1 Tax=Protea cynaroides TaxID=273540 RepID=A0A9Q0QU26_9MAGN|nr:hypothetical protein NE237_004901 [Protea cynaroides]
MALSNWVITALLFSLVLSHVEPSSSGQTHLKGSVSCLDCTDNSQLHGIRVLVGCDRVKKMTMAVTDDKGHFKTELPRDSSSKTSTKCLAKLLGGRTQLCSSRKTQVSNVVEVHGSKSYTIDKPLAFYSTSCSSITKGKIQSSLSDLKTTSLMDFEPSKIPDLPMPPEWGLAPSSDYLPVLPIIGIP